MTYANKRYGLGHIVGVREGEIGKIIGMTENTVSVRYSNQTTITVDWNSIYPIPIEAEMMRKIGFSTMKKLDLLHHIEHWMDIKINGKFYTLVGYILKDRSLWSFNNTSARYIHQIQSLLWIIEPVLDLNLNQNN